MVKSTSHNFPPHGWVTKKLSDVVEFLDGKRKPIRDADRQKMKGPYPYYGASGIVDHVNAYLFDEDLILLGEDGENILSRNVRLAFKVSGKVWVNNHAHVLRPKSGYNLGFLVEKLESLNYEQYNTGTAQPKLNKSVCSNIELTIPNTETEQTAIATALSDADALIASLEKLIAKKRLIKQGVMQKLLEPKEGWEEKSLFEIADSKKALFDDGDWIEAEHITDKGIRLIQTGNIGVGEFLDRELKKYIFPQSFTDLKCKEIYEGDLLICRLADPAGRACVLPDIKESRIITSVDVTIFRPRRDVANRIFLTNVFSTSNWLRKVGEMTGGTTHKRISRGALGRIRISLPSIQEQNDIAAILFDMDNEIKALHNKLEKVKLQKQGMMQTLLTGKIRLV